jgi:anti-sigma28 factor (negative regulator of flagellin synthesis)
MQTYLWGAVEKVQVDQQRAERVAESDPQRIARVLALRQQIREGTYHVSALDVADRMLESLRWP